MNKFVSQWRKIESKSYIFEDINFDFSGIYFDFFRNFFGFNSSLKWQKVFVSSCGTCGTDMAKPHKAT